MKAAVLALALAASTFAAAAQEVEHYQKRDASVALIRVDGVAGFQMQSQAGQNTCSLEGRAVFTDKSSAAYTSDDMADMCVVIFTFKGRNLVVTTKDCGRHCGLNAGSTMDGTYSLKR